MKRFDVTLEPSLPSLKQVLWRSGCPPEKAGPGVNRSAQTAIDTLGKALSGAWCGAVLFAPDEAPSFPGTIFSSLPVTVMAATLGWELDELIQGPAGLENYMLDSAASVAVESYMKKMQLFLAGEMKLLPTKRVAPGYGDIPLSAQAEIIDMFPDSGISCSSEFMLSPVKSMTGAVGWIQQKG